MHEPDQGDHEPMHEPHQGDHETSDDDTNQGDEEMSSGTSAMPISVSQNLIQ